MRLVYIAAAWCGGILAAAQWRGNTATWLMLGLASLIAVFPAPQAARRWIVLIVCFAIGGARLAMMPTGDAVSAWVGFGMTLEGRVTQPPARRDDRTNVTLAVDSMFRVSEVEPVSGTVLVQAPPNSPIRYGDRIAVTGLLTQPGRFDRFSYADYLARAGIYSVMRGVSVASVTPAAEDWRGALFKLRDRVSAQINAHLPEPAAGLLRGILLGDESSIARQTRDAFAATGAAHVVAISGFNMAILAGMVGAGLKTLRLPSAAIILITIVILGVYTLFVGASAGVVRAAVMSSVLLIGRSLGRRVYLPTSLAFTALVMSVFDPFILWDIGFQLSFFAVLSIALFAEPISRALGVIAGAIAGKRNAQRWLPLLNESIGVTTAASLMTLPLTAVYFGQIAPATLPVNILIGFVQPLILIGGGLTVILSALVPTMAALFYGWMLLPLGWMIGIVDRFAHLTTATVYVAPNTIALGMSFVLIAAALYADRPPRLERSLRRFLSSPLPGIVVFACIATLALIIALIAARPDGRLHVWFLDVGHANAVLLQTPGGAHILIDGGNEPSRLLTAVGQRLPFHKRTIDLAFVTEPDERQYGALPVVMERYTIDGLIYHGQPNRRPLFESLTASMADGRLHHLRAGRTIRTSDGVQIAILHPASRPAIGDSLGANALVIHITYGDSTFLLPAMLTSSGQERMLKTGAVRHATVLQIPAHGGTRSLDPDFLAAVAPQIAVLQADEGNSWGDPDPDTIDLLSGLPLYRTDRDGTIHLVSDGSTLTVVPSRQGDR